MTANSKTALITGASSGLGEAFAHRLAAEGYHLILVARREERLQALAAELERRRGVTAEVLPADIGDPVELGRLEARIKSLDRLDMLVNNAGFGAPGSFAEVEIDRQVAMIQVHIVATMRLCYATLPGMAAHNQGFIINVSSFGAFMPMPRAATYAATKAFLINFSENLQTQLAHTPIRVQALCPGYLPTEFHAAAGGQMGGPSRVPGLMRLTAEQVVAESLRALRRGKVVVVPGRPYRFLLALLRFGPVAWMPRWIIYQLRRRGRH